MISVNEAGLITAANNKYVAPLKGFSNEMLELEQLIVATAQEGKSALYYNEFYSSSGLSYGRKPSGRALAKLEELGYLIEFGTFIIDDGPNEGSYKTLTIKWARQKTDKEQRESEAPNT